MKNKRSIAIVLGIFAIALCLPGCTGYNNKVQTGPAVSGAGEVPGIFVSGSKGVFGASVAVKVTTEGTFSADSITFDPTSKQLNVQKPLLQPANMVALTDARTNQIINALLPMSKEYTAWSAQLGDHAVQIIDSLMNPFDILASAAPILVGGQVSLQLPRGVSINGKSILAPEDQAKLLAQMAAVIQALKAGTPPPAGPVISAPPATQPASKADPVPVPV